MINYFYPKYYLAYEGDGGSSDSDSGAELDTEPSQGVSGFYTDNGVILPAYSNGMAISGALTYPSAQANVGGLVSTLHHGAFKPGVEADIFTIIFTAKEGYFYSKEPTPNIEFEEKDDYTIIDRSEVLNETGKLIEKSFIIKYTDNGTVPKINDHSIFFTHETSPIMLPPKQLEEINSITIDLKDIPQGGSVRTISISGTTGTPFAMSINDMYGNNVLAPTKRYDRILQIAITSSQMLNLDTTDYLQVGMQLSGSGVGDGVTISSIKDNKNIIISKPQTISADTVLTFSSGSLLDDAVIPMSGAYSFDQVFPALRTYTKTLKEAASSATALTLDSTLGLEIGMRVTGTGVDGEYVTIENIDSGTQITVSVAQTIADETNLAFTISHNIYSVHLKPHKGSRLSTNIPQAIPTYYIKQHIDPIIAFSPTTTLASSSVTGTVSLTKPTGYMLTPSENTTATTINISMVATSTSGSFEIDRQPRFSNSNSALSDFTNTSSITKQVAVYSGVETPIVVLNNTTDLAVGMRVTGSSIVQPVIPTDCKEVQSPINPDYKDVTIKSITSNTIELSWPQTIPCESSLRFSNGGTSIFISGLKAVLSENVGVGDDPSAKIKDGICTVTGTGVISKFGKDSITCAIDFDNFLSKA